MLPLFKINLLPYREALQAKKKKEFQTLLLGAVLIGLGLATLGYFIMDGVINRQEQRVLLLQNGIKILDDEIGKIAELKEERKNFIARQQKVEELSNRRFEAAHILDTLNSLAPIGLYITSIEAQDPNTYIINGKAYSDSRTAAFMSALPGRLFSTPELLNIKRVNNAQEFSIKVSLNINNSDRQIEEAMELKQSNKSEEMTQNQIESSQQDDATDQTSSASASEASN